MTAHVAEGTKSAVLVADDNDGFARYIGGEVRFRIGNGAFCAVCFTARLIECANQLPGAKENVASFECEDRRVRVETRGERLGAFELRVDIERRLFGGHEKKVTVQSQKFKVSGKNGK